MLLSAGLVALLSACIAGCDTSGSLAAVGDVPPNQVTFLFKMHGDVSGVDLSRCHGRSGRDLRCARQVAAARERAASVHLGPIDRGNSDNLEWNWHFVPGQWMLTELAIELCDGNAELVSEDVDYQVGTLGQFCRWSSYVASEVPEER